jgi:hypothetical protein
MNAKPSEKNRFAKMNKSIINSPKNKVIKNGNKKSNKIKKSKEIA